MKDCLKKLSPGWSQGTSWGLSTVLQIYDELTNLKPCSFQSMLIFNNKEASFKKYCYFPNHPIFAKNFAQLSINACPNT